MEHIPPKTSPSAEIAIILVNWNGWRDTIECLESIFKNGCKNFQAIVCDNASTDRSWEKIISWAAGNELVVPASDEMASYSQPPINKPVAIKLIDQDGNVSGDPDAKLILIQTGANLGFAGGNNVGMRYALDHNDCEYFWLLNNDTVILQDAIGHLIQHMKASPSVGMCGTRIHFYHQPDTIQALGGATYNKWAGTSKCIGSCEPVELDILDKDFNKECDFIIGASMCLSREFLTKVGLMEERYFLYYEEIDWARRAQGILGSGYVKEVTVFHKEGGTIGSNSKKGMRSALSEYYLMRSKIEFTKRFHPFLLITIYIYGLGQIMSRLFRGNSHLGSSILKALLRKPFAPYDRVRSK